MCAVLEYLLINKVEESWLMIVENAPRKEKLPLFLDYYFQQSMENQNISIEMWNINTLRKVDADLRFYIITVQDGRCKSAFLTRACFPCTIHLIMQYIEPVSEWSC